MRHFALILLAEDGAGIHNIFRLAVIEAARFNFIFQAAQAELQDFVGAVVGGEKIGRDNIDPFVGALRRKDNRHEQFEI